ncbi:hypothetical protein R70241_05441 [Paraburkholderia saeva]|nr:hypothetical protein R70241_05441 [Paraburkholderia saeva]
MSVDPLIPLYDDDERSWRATTGASLFGSDQTMRFFVSGDRRRKLIEAGLIFFINKRMVTDAPADLYNAIVAMKKEAARERVRDVASDAPVDPVKPKTARVTTLRGNKGNQFEVEPA